MTTFAAAAKSIEALEAEIAAELDKRYRLRRLMRRSDFWLNRAEEANRDGRPLPSVDRLEVASVVQEMAPKTNRLPADAQEAVDAILAAQEVLLRLMHPEVHQPDYTVSDLRSWEAVCLQIEADEILRDHEPRSVKSELEVMREHRLAHIRHNRWRAWPDWQARLEELRAALEEWEAACG